ncbi:hypothetical protein Aca07nite_64160 [Actinoplanes capillaceus]|uniref:Uncharacterized protein n=1 Tax=Actinoplanes campanulatus TaxID=113559 RepID=A0ABQ3WS74_9ACTN|nr:hypothetical protein Aca07nite_64160 [Actinoplanes capillaceus]
MPNDRSPAYRLRPLRRVRRPASACVADYYLTGATERQAGTGNGGWQLAGVTESDPFRWRISRVNIAMLVA